MSQELETSAPPEGAIQYLIGIRLREPVMAEDYLTTDTDLHVGDFCVVETGGGTAVGEVRRPRRPLRTGWESSFRPYA